MALINLSSLGLNPPIVTMNNCNTDDLVRLISGLNLKKTEKKLISAIQEVSESSETKYTNVSAIAHYLKKSEGSIRKTLKDLVQSGVFEETYCQSHPTVVRRSSLFSLKEINQDDTVIESTEQLNLELKKREAISKISMEEKDPYGRSDDLICKHLFVVLEYKGKGDTRESSSIVYINKEPIQVTAKTDGDRVARIKDLRYYIAVLKNCENQVKLRLEAAEVGALSSEEIKSTLFDLHETDILNSADISTGSGEREHLKTAMYRLDGTNYYIDNPSIHLMNEYGLKERRVKISHFNLVDYSKNNSGRRFYRIELHQRTVDGMLRATRNEVDFFKKIQKEAFQESNALKLAIILWSSHLQVGKAYRLKWQDLKDFVYPKQSMSIFKKDIKNLIINNAAKHILEYDGSIKTDSKGNPIKSIIYDASGDVIYCSSSLFDMRIDYNNTNDVGEFTIRRIVSSEKIMDMIKRSKSGVSRGSKRKKLTVPPSMKKK
jgi:predicted transcriptional regulator